MFLLSAQTSKTYYFLQSYKNTLRHKKINTLNANVLQIAEDLQTVLSTLLQLNFFSLVSNNNFLTYTTPSLNTTHSASCYYYIRRELRCIRPYLVFQTIDLIRSDRFKIRGPDYGKCLGPTTFKRLTKDGCTIF